MVMSRYLFLVDKGCCGLVWYRIGSKVGVGMLRKEVVARMDVTQRLKRSFMADGVREHMQQFR
jgi:hypothetical protein